MFRTIASLLLFGALSPLSGPVRTGFLREVPGVAPPSSVSPFPLARALSASGAMVIDLLSGKELFSLAPDQPRPIASLAKIMTAIVILEQHAPDEIVTIPAGVEEVEGNRAGLRGGDRYTVRSLLGALLVGSANDAAETLALHHSGSIPHFAEAMNARAQALGLTRTHFDNPVGFDSPKQASTPRELAWLAMFAWKNELVRSLVGKREFTLKERSGKREITVVNTNQLLLSHPASFFGLKTGTTELAGECLISLAYASGRPYIFVILKSANRYSDTLHLLRSLPEKQA